MGQLSTHYEFVLDSTKQITAIRKDVDTKVRKVESLSISLTY